jgi:hypothetical protein
VGEEGGSGGKGGCGRKGGEMTQTLYARMNKRKKSTTVKKKQQSGKHDRRGKHARSHSLHLYVLVYFLLFPGLVSKFQALRMVFDPQESSFHLLYVDIQFSQ